MSAHYNANSQRVTHRMSGAHHGDSRRAGNEASVVASGATDPTSLVPRSHPAPVSPYGGTSTPYGDPSGAIYQHNISLYSTQPRNSTSSSLHQSPPQPSSLYDQGNYTLRSSQPASPVHGEFSNSYDQRSASNTAPGTGHGYRSPSFSQSPGIDAITDGIGSLTTSPTGAQWSTTPGPGLPGHDAGISHSVQPMSRGSNVSQNVISGTSSTHNTTLDPRYTVQKSPKSFFRVGRVFAILWHENEGSSGRGTQSYISVGPVYIGRFNEPVHSGIRRMVVVKALDQCAWCFPVSTYSRKGVAKTGVDASKHAIIYMQGTEPQRGSGEPQMMKEPLEVAPASPDQKLDYMSRLNFGKIYTVEHNVKVLPVGKITERSMPRFQNYAKSEFNVMS
ncbi:uncharacterized protein KD926_002759 [Aspergillus affinis]|uniref:uncharacterized protein n=1 Tax=Aspergillus affinis TaxID=1070780 RepID=UPI0022FE412E|nr:uncharacterized protein KD926_002759 [Aspergillus affinis]KAI9043868.1 hypothetical protein KD926_002759 [Aspergillus affinis]